MGAIDAVLAFVKVVASELIGPNSEPTFNVAAVGDFRLDAAGAVVGEDDSDQQGEQAAQQVSYGPLGFMARPLRPEGRLFAEAVALRVDDGLHPIGWRDMRLHRAVNPGASGGQPGTTPREGQQLLAGYGGAFFGHSMTGAPSGSKRANISTVYCPYDFDSAGVPQKAHVIMLDPSNGSSSIQIIHGDGLFFTMSEDNGSGPGFTMAVDGSTFLRMNAGEVVVQAAKIMMKGNVYLGAAAEAGLNALFTGSFPAPLPPAPSPSVFLSVL